MHVVMELLDRGVAVLQCGALRQHLPLEALLLELQVGDVEVQLCIGLVVPLQLLVHLLQQSKP